MVKVLDASALVVYLWKQAGHEKVQDLLAKAVESEKRLLMTAVNFGEVYYLLIRDHGREEAERILQLVETLPIDFVEAGLELAKQAAVYKAVYKLPFADSFAAALAKARKGELVTKDADFKTVEKEIKIVWL
jgi:predicted nucleic acid-binding protein